MRRTTLAKLLLAVAAGMMLIAIFSGWGFCGEKPQQKQKAPAQTQGSPAQTQNAPAQTQGTPAQAQKAPPQTQDAPQQTREDEVFDMGEVVVTGSRVPLPLGKTPSNTTVVPREVIEQSHAKSVDDLLRDLPGVQVRSYGTPGSTSSVSIRGSRGTQVLVMIDGRPMNTPNNGEADLSQILTSDIERIEIVRGPSSSLYGSNAVSGVINIITRKGAKKPGALIDYSAGTYDTSIGFANISLPLSKNTSLRLTPTLSSSAGNRRNGYVQGSSVTISLDSKAGEADIRLNAGVQSNRAGNPGVRPPAEREGWNNTQRILGDDEITSPFDYTVNNNRFVDGSITHKDLKFRFYHNSFNWNFHSELIDTARRRNYYDTEGRALVTGLDANYRFPYGNDSGLIIGGATENQDFGYNDVRWVPATARTTRSSYAAKRIMNSWYLENLLKSGRLTFSLGVRGDSPSDFQSQISPRAALLYGISQDVNLRICYGTSYRAPTMNDMYWPDTGGARGNRNLRPERGRTFEVGLESLLGGEKILARLDYFNEDISDMIAWSPSGPIGIYGTPYWQPTNINSVRKRGFEAELQYKPSEKLHFTGNYTYIDAWQENEEIVPGVLVGRQAAFIPRYTMNLKLTYSLPKQYYATLEHISVSERLNYFQDSTVGAMRTGSLSPYSLLNLTLGKKIGREGENELYMVWDNITNQEYSLQFGGLQYNSTYTKSFWSRGYPMPLSSIRVGARLKF